MASTFAQQRHRRKLRLFSKQKGRCHWCGQACELTTQTEFMPAPENMATVDHLYPRGHPMRRRTLPDKHVMACFRCNNTRGNRPAEEWAQIVAPIMVMDDV